MKIKLNGGAQQALNVVKACKPFLSKVLLVMKSVNGIINIAKNSDSNASTELITDPLAPINLPIVCENPKKTPNQMIQKRRTCILQLIINL